MQINILKNEGQEKELEITAPWSMVEEEYKDILKRYSKLSLKGFRPGKAPVGAVESFFRNEIRNELLSATSTRLCRTALKEKGLEAGSPIELSDIDSLKGTHLRFRAAFIEMPAFELPDYRHLALESLNLEEQLDEVSNKLLDRTPIPLHPVFIENEKYYSEPSGENTPEAEDAIADRVRLMLILKKIASQDAIEVDTRDVDQRIRLIAAENEVTPEELRDYLVTNGGIPRLTDTLLAESVLHYIIEEQQIY